jgi:C-terminal processing protease CtpA/Prc
MREDTVAIEVEQDGATVERELEPVSFQEHEAFAGRHGVIRLPFRDDTRYLDQYEVPLTWERMGSALYVRLTEIRDRPEPALVRAVHDRKLDRLVLDLRQNPGGDNHNNPPVVDLARTFQERHPGAPVVVLTDRVTFSAASNLATDLERLVDPVFVGEAMGGGLNFWNDVAWVNLDALPVPMQVGVSTRYWQQAADLDDPRLTIEPDVPVAVEASDYFAGHDPTLEAALGELP